MRYNKKGFTLVEVIVVLVILAILAGIMIPAMTGWIDKAKEKQIVVEARTALLACQTIASENYATDGVKAFVSADYTAAKSLSGLTGSITDVELQAGTAQVTAMTYASGGYTCTYDGSAFSPSKAAATQPTR